MGADQAGRLGQAQPVALLAAGHQPAGYACGSEEGLSATVHRMAPRQARVVGRFQGEGGAFERRGRHKFRRDRKDTKKYFVRFFYLLHSIWIRIILESSLSESPSPPLFRNIFFCPSQCHHRHRQHRAHIMFQRVNEAHEVLSDPTKRRTYEYSQRFAPSATSPSSSPYKPASSYAGYSGGWPYRSQYESDDDDEDGF